MEPRPVEFFFPLKHGLENLPCLCANPKENPELERAGEDNLANDTREDLFGDEGGSRLLAMDTGIRVGPAHCDSKCEFAKSVRRGE